MRPYLHWEAKGHLCGWQFWSGWDLHWHVWHPLGSVTRPPGQLVNPQSAGIGWQKGGCWQTQVSHWLISLAYPSEQDVGHLTGGHTWFCESLQEQMSQPLESWSKPDGQLAWKQSVRGVHWGFSHWHRSQLFESFLNPSGQEREHCDGTHVCPARWLQAQVGQLVPGKRSRPWGQLSQVHPAGSEGHCESAQTHMSQLFWSFCNPFST